MTQIRTWNELLEAGVGVITEQISPEDIEFGEGLVLRLRVRGDSWDGLIDYRGAQFVIDLQKAVEKTYKELGGPDVPLRDLQRSVIVKVKVVDGSSIFEIKLDETLKAIVGKMTGRQITLIVTMAIFCATGYFTTKEVLQFKQEQTRTIQEKQLAETYVEKMSSTMDQALDIIEKNDVQAAPRKLVRKLQPEDYIQLPGKDIMRPEEAKKLYPRKPKARKETGFFDGSYIVSAINFDKRPVQFTLKKADYEFHADAELADEDVERLSNSLKTAMKNNEDLVIDLRIFVVYNKREMKSASIQGTGEPRDSSDDFSKLVQLWQQT